MKLLLQHKDPTSLFSKSLLIVATYLSVSAFPTVVELRKKSDSFFASISKIFVSLNFRAEKKDQFMLLKEYRLSNSKFHQSLVQGDLPLSN